MPEHLKALVVILVLAAAVFVVARAPITAQACSVQDFDRRRNLWFVLTLAAFLAHSIWLFVVIAACALVVAVRAEGNRFALYLTVMLALPRVTASIPGFGLVNELFEVNPLRLLALFVLLPTYLSLRKQLGVEPFGRLLCDKLLLCSLALEVILNLPHRTFTSVLKDSVVYTFTDTFLIYYVASRSLRSLKAFRDAFGAFTVGAMVLCATVVFEFWQGWLLYRAVDDALGVSAFEWGYMFRAGLLRAEGTTQQPIIVGYTCAVAMGLYLYLGTLVPNVAVRRAGMVVLIAGLVTGVSRGPWLGAALMVVLFLVLGPTPVASVAKLAMAGLLALPILLMTKGGAFIIDLLPWVGSVEASTVEGRESLATAAVQVFLQNPYFGRFDFITDPALEELGSAGFVDLVNTYVVIALKGGGVSLALFLGLVAVASIGIVNGLRSIGDKRDERYLLGRTLLATLLGILFIIGTVSPISFVYPIYWCVIGFAVSYARLVEHGEAGAVSGAAAAARKAANAAPQCIKEAGSRTR